MKKVLLSAAVVLGFIFYSFRQTASQATTAASAPPNLMGDQISQSASPAAGSGDNPPVQSAPTATAAAPKASSKSKPPAVAAAKPKPATGQYKDGSYTGSVADAYYGNVQVQVTVAGGKITDVAFLQYPNDRHTSAEISQQAMPILKQETISRQNAQVDIVSGATQFSQGYIQSLASALTQAKS